MMAATTMAVISAEATMPLAAAQVVAALATG